MPSFQISITPSRRKATRYIDKVRRAIQKALLEEHRKSGLTQSDIARTIGVHRSVINREIRGQKDMTIGRVGELAHALGREPIFELREPQVIDGANIPPPGLLMEVMFPRSVVSLFCDDIRDEKSGMDTLVGVYPDNLNVPSFPCALPKLGIYTRITIDVADSPGTMTVRILNPGENDAIISGLTEEFISKSQLESKKNGSPITGLISKGIAAPFLIKEAGQVKIIVTIQDVEYVGGVLNVRPAP